MKRRVQNLHAANAAPLDTIPDGIYLVRVDHAQYQWHAQKPYYLLRLSVLEPKEPAGRSITGRIYCTAKALWKLNWFLRDFGYDLDLLGRDEVDNEALVGLRGVVKISHAVVNGVSLLNFDGFAPASQWQGTPTPSESSGKSPEMAS